MKWLQIKELKFLNFKQGDGLAKMGAYKLGSELMKIDKKRVEYVATLARLKLSEEEEKTYALQLSHILKYIETLNKVNTEGVPPTYNVIEHKNMFRSEELKPTIEENNSLFKNAPELKNKFVTVPKIIDV